MKRYERAGVREPRDLSRWDLWKKYVIGTHRRFDPIDPKVAGTDGGNRYFYEEATWQKGDSDPKIVAQVQPDFGTLDDDGRYLWSVLWEFADGAWRDHGKLNGRGTAKARCIEIVEEGAKAAYARRQATSDSIVSVQSEAWPEYAPDIDDGAEWRQVKPKRGRKATKAKTTPIETYDDVPE